MTVIRKTFYEISAVCLIRFRLTMSGVKCQTVIKTFLYKTLKSLIEKFKSEDVSVGLSCVLVLVQSVVQYKYLST